MVPVRLTLRVRRSSMALAVDSGAMLRGEAERNPGWRLAGTSAAYPGANTACPETCTAQLTLKGGSRLPSNPVIYEM